MKKIILKILGHCDNCNRYFVYPRKRRMNTEYVDEESNYCTVCKECFKEIENYWDEKWKEYNAERY